MELKDIPSIEQLRQRPAMRALEEQFGRAAVIDALRAEAELAASSSWPSGQSIADGGDHIERASGREVAQHAADVASASDQRDRRDPAHQSRTRAARGRAQPRQLPRRPRRTPNLEYDLERGARGRRDVHAERLLREVTGAEAACVVNNNAAATLLTLAALANGREVIVSRGELVEIGGGFRVPDVMAQSGAVLREVGTTNRTRAADYAAAIGDRTALILRVHPSNFRIEGFTERPNIPDLAELGRQFNLPVVEDIGSGYIETSAMAALREEPLPVPQPSRRRRRRDVQRRQAARRSAGGNHRRQADLPGQDPPASADARAAGGQDDLRGARGHARGLRLRSPRTRPCAADDEHDRR